jgi:hypothetical protein
MISVLPALLPLFFLTFFPLPLHFFLIPSICLSSLFYISFPDIFGERLKIYVTAPGVPIIISFLEYSADGGA